MGNVIAIDHLHISHFNSKIVNSLELFPFKAGQNVPFHAKFNENNIIVSHNLFNILML